MRNVTLQIHGCDKYRNPRDFLSLGGCGSACRVNFVIVGGTDARNGWNNFHENYIVKEFEDYRYLSWYFTMLLHMYHQGLSTNDLIKVFSSDPTSVLISDFQNATDSQKGSLVVAHSGLKSLLGIHVSSRDDLIFWQEKPDRVDRFIQISSMGLVLLSLFQPGGFFSMGWVWKPEGFVRRRAWFINQYHPPTRSVSSQGLMDSSVFVDHDSDTIVTPFDTNILIPPIKYHVKADSVTKGALPRRLSISSKSASS